MLCQTVAVAILAVSQFTQSQTVCSDGQCYTGGYPTGNSYIIDRAVLPRNRSVTVVAPVRPAPMVVRISSTLYPGTKWGSGTWVKGGYVVTCAHILRIGWAITVHFPDGQEIPAAALHMDDSKDLAILRLATMPNPPVLSANLSPGKVPAGTAVLLAGYSGGVYGVASGGTAGYEGDDLITRATVKEGNSGGPVYVPNGPVVGIISDAPYGGSTVDGVNSVYILRVLHNLQMLQAKDGPPVRPIVPVPPARENGSNQTEARPGGGFTHFTPPAEAPDNPSDNPDTSQFDDLIAKLEALQQAIANIEKTPGQQGEPGSDGQDGKDGVDGQDGKDAVFNLEAVTAAVAANLPPMRFVMLNKDGTVRHAYTAHLGETVPFDFGPVGE